MASLERREKRRSVLRVSRIPDEMDRLLRKDAADKRMSVNALVNSIFTKYLEWDRYAERFGYVSVGRELLATVLEAADEDQIARAGDGLGGHLIKQFMLFWFKRVSVDAFLDYVSIVCKYGGVMKCELEQEGRDHTITAIHELGMNWSIFLKHFIDSGLRSSLGIAAEFDLTKNTVVCRFVAP